MDGLAASVTPDVAPWRPPPFCRLSWSGERARNVWEPRLQAAREALEDLAVLRSAEDGRARLLFARGASVERLGNLARAERVSLRSLTLPQHADDVAVGRSGRVALAI